MKEYVKQEIKRGLIIGLSASLIFVAILTFWILLVKFII